MRKSKLSYIKKCVLEENLGGGGGEAALLRDSGPFRAYTRHRSNAWNNAIFSPYPKKSKFKDIVRVSLHIFTIGLHIITQWLPGST